MKLQITPPGSLNAFSGYGEGYVLVNQRRYQRSIVVTPERVIEDWPPDGLDALSAAHLEVIARLDCAIVLLGTGATLRFPNPAVLRPLIERGIGCEVMDVTAACRTYNILMAEGRRVAAALILD